jgi:N-acetylmuramoyl-L-alanine amidase CwlA
MRAEDTDWYFKPEVVERLVEFTKYLMKKYNVPADRVIRHYDVTHKICPNPYVVNAAAQAAWVGFKKRLVDTPAPVAPPTPAPAVTAYKVRVTASALNIRKGPGTQHAVTGVITDKGVYTIVDTQNGWGKLKSGAGWISLNYTTRV